MTVQKFSIEPPKEETEEEKLKKKEIEKKKNEKKTFNKPNEVITTSSNHLSLISKKIFNNFLQMVHLKLKDDITLKEIIEKHRMIDEPLKLQKREAKTQAEIDKIQNKIEKEYEKFDKEMHNYIYNNKLQFYFYSVTDIKKTLGMEQSKNWEHIKDSLAKLQLVQVEMLFPSNSNSKLKKGTIFTLIGDIKYSEIGFEVEISIEIVKAVIDNRRGFTPLSIVNLNLLKSKYSLILYEFFMRYKNINMPILSMEDFLDLLGLYTVTEKNGARIKTLRNSYARFSTIKQQIIDKALVEIKEKLGLTYGYNTYKEKNKVVSIQFEFLKVEKAEVEKLDLQEEKTLANVEETLKKNTTKKTKDTTKIKKTKSMIEADVKEQIRVTESISNFSESYQEILNLPTEIQELLEKKAYEKFLLESNTSDNKLMQGIFEKSKKPLIYEEYKLYKIENTIEPPLKEKENIMFIKNEQIYSKGQVDSSAENISPEKKMDLLIKLMSNEKRLSSEELEIFKSLNKPKEILSFFLQLNLADILLEK